MVRNFASSQAVVRNRRPCLRDWFAVPVLVVSLAGFLGVPVQVLGAGEVKSAKCDDARTTAAMRQCENTRLMHAEEAMNAAYRALSAKLDGAGQEKLSAAQDAWLKFRAAEANYQANLVRDGTLAPLIRVSVQADMTESRRKDLEQAAQAYR